jgi:hypothetical protein
MGYVRLTNNSLSCNYMGLNDCEIFRNEIYRKNQKISYYDLIICDLT